MGVKFDEGLGLTGGYEEGENGWTESMNKNLSILNANAGGTIAILSTMPNPEESGIMDYLKSDPAKTIGLYLRATPAESPLGGSFAGKPNYIAQYMGGDEFRFIKPYPGMVVQVGLGSATLEYFDAPSNNGTGAWLKSNVAGTQADWNEMETGNPAYIKNKPVIGSVWENTYMEQIGYRRTLSNDAIKMIFRGKGCYIVVSNRLIARIPDNEANASDLGIQFTTFKFCAIYNETLAVQLDNDVYVTSDGWNFKKQTLAENETVIGLSGKLSTSVTGATQDPDLFFSTVVYKVEAGTNLILGATIKHYNAETFEVILTSATNLPGGTKAKRIILAKTINDHVAPYSWFVFENQNGNIDVWRQRGTISETVNILTASGSTFVDCILGRLGSWNPHVLIRYTVGGAPQIRLMQIDSTMMTLTNVTTNGIITPSLNRLVMDSYGSIISLDGKIWTLRSGALVPLTGVDESIYDYGVAGGGWRYGISTAGQTGIVKYRVTGNLPENKPRLLFLDRYSDSASTQAVFDNGNTKEFFLEGANMNQHLAVLRNPMQLPG